MCRKYLKVLLLTFATGCTAGNSLFNAAEGDGFEIVIVEKQLDDSSSPVGYWEISLSYPQLKKPDNDTLVSVNKKIVALVNKYSCQGPGDQTFTAADIYSNGHVLSFYYEAMWMCATMPSPDSVSNTVSYNLETGAPLLIDKEFINSAARDRFIVHVNKLLQKKLENLSEKSPSCMPFNNVGHALLTSKGLAMRGLATMHGGSGCPDSVVIPKKDLSLFFKSNSLILR
jgi:hypothetical protein